MINKINELRKRYNNFKFKTEEPILDIGGGIGEFLISQNIKNATIVDLREKPNNSTFKYIKADITKKLPIHNAKFKTIFLTEVLEHIKNPLYLLSQVFDLLENDGVCYIAIPYTEISPNHHHVCRWTKHEILNQASKLGFKPRVIQSRKRFKGFGFFLPHCWLVLELKKRAENKGGDHRIRFYK